MNDEAQALLDKYKPKQQQVLETDRHLMRVRFSPCGNLLLAAGCDATLRRWDLAGEEVLELPKLTGHNGWIEGLELHPTEKLAFSADSWGQLRASRYEGEAPETVWSVEDAHDGWIHGLAVSPDGQYVATGGNDQVVRIWQASDGKKLQELSGHDHAVMAVAFHAEGKSLVSGDLLGQVQEWDVQNGQPLRKFDAAQLHNAHRLQDVGGVRCLGFDAEGKTLLVGGTVPKNGGNVQGVPTLLRFDWGDGKPAEDISLGATSDVYLCEFAPHSEGFYVMVTSGGPGVGKLLCLRLGDEKPFFEQKLTNPHSLTLHPDGKRFAVAATNNGSNGNGRRVDKDGNYLGNHSPVHLFELAGAEPA